MHGLEIRGLTLTRPWPFAISEGGKRIENRDWAPPKSLIGHYLALHSGKGWSEEDREWIANLTGLYVPNREESPYSVIFAVCMLGGYIITDRDHRFKEGQRKWFFGPYGWLLEDMVLLKTPVPCRGMQKLWMIPPEVLEQLREEYKKSA
jgi:hypothetical protein